MIRNSCLLRWNDINASQQRGGGEVAINTRITEARCVLGAAMLAEDFFWHTPDCAIQHTERLLCNMVGEVESDRAPSIDTAGADCRGKPETDVIARLLSNFPLIHSYHIYSALSSSQNNKLLTSMLCLGGPESSSLSNALCGTCLALPSFLESYCLKTNASSGIRFEA